jgi:hypothetical protein
MREAKSKKQEAGDKKKDAESEELQTMSCVLRPASFIPLSANRRLPIANSYGTPPPHMA